MIAYTTVGSNDLAKAVPFYTALLEGVLGAKVFFKSENGVGWGVGPDKPMFTAADALRQEPRDRRQWDDDFAGVFGSRSGEGAARQGARTRRQGRGRAGAARRRLLRLLFPRSRRQQARRLLHGRELARKPRGRIWWRSR